ncbi:hypothetical protein ACA910_007533 [Epithemia clementina (nom. ined.)]
MINSFTQICRLVGARCLALACVLQAREPPGSATAHTTQNEKRYAHLLTGLESSAELSFKIPFAITAITVANARSRNAVVHFADSCVHFFKKQCCLPWDNTEPLNYTKQEDGSSGIEGNVLLSVLTPALQQILGLGAGNPINAI